jgi:hypothetical protein
MLIGLRCNRVRMRLQSVQGSSSTVGCSGGQQLRQSTACILPVQQFTSS